MSQAAEDVDGLSKRRKLGPDYFGYYTHEVVELLSRNEDASPFASKSSDVSQSRRVEVIGEDRIENGDGVSGSLFSNSLGNELSEFTKERLELLLRQGVKVLAPEVDEMIEPVVGMSRLKSRLESRKCLSRGASSSCSSSKEVDDEWQSLIQSNSLQVEEAVKKYSDQYYSELGHMEQQLEKILDTVMSKCRPMTIHEKHKLGNLIQKLPPENLDRVMEIIQNSNPAHTSSSDEVHVDLEKESNVTLWRLFNYVKAVEKARKAVENAEELAK
ncbi:PREDICTED: uncharacterized protein LOC101314011 [Fragaria vesca subsp. vesca]|uniref:uncharacterized protein LOC101314011 n=1 Tax=Fragaria vesca subsp. vesca TaxID=101020 RepID=UPI0002C2F131|nr:PREDICTED: uncharacterized protein LOC101314011 [Fragaria vesca subsp. vesca]XP_011468327.1 PREDICTED: uncharacterized protein LOC101314011 [Fragaria vesca subsp. vesca]